MIVLVSVMLRELQINFAWCIPLSLFIQLNDFATYIYDVCSSYVCMRHNRSTILNHILSLEQVYKMGIVKTGTCRCVVVA